MSNTPRSATLTRMLHQIPPIWSEDARVAAPVTEILFVDAAMPPDAVAEADLRPGVALHRLRGDKPILTQIATALRGHAGLRAIHILAHGAPGALRFAAGHIDDAKINANPELLARIGAALDGDIVLWCCRAGEGATGRRFIAALAHATGARVAAASAPVGAVWLGGDWVLDVATGAVAVASPLHRIARASFAHMM